MGYACPVCGTPQRDGEHLAHHLAFTAMLHGDDHAAWLDEHAPEWGTADPAGLAETVTRHADPAEYHEVFEDTTDRGQPDVDVGEFNGSNRAVGRDHARDGHDHAHDGHDHAHDGRDSPSRRADTTADTSAVRGGEVDPETAAAIREARELTRRMYDDGDDRDGNDVGDTGVGGTGDTDDTDGNDTDDDPGDVADADGGSGT